MSSVVSSSRVRPALKWSVAEVAGDGHQPGAEVLALPAEAAHAAQRPEEGLGGEVLGEGRRAGCGSRRSGRPSRGSGRRAGRTPRCRRRGPARPGRSAGCARPRSSSEEAARSESSYAGRPGDGAAGDRRPRSRSIHGRARPAGLRPSGRAERRRGTAQRAGRRSPRAVSWSRPRHGCQSLPSTRWMAPLSMVGAASPQA